MKTFELTETSGFADPGLFRRMQGGGRDRQGMEAGTYQTILHRR